MDNLGALFHSKQRKVTKHNTVLDYILELESRHNSYEGKG